MNFLQFIVFTAVVVSGVPTEDKDTKHRRITHRTIDTIDDPLPSFEKQTGSTANCDSKANFCLIITYSDGSNDIVSAYETKWSEGVLSGKLPSNGGKVVIILADEDNAEDTIAFKSEKARGCTRFSVNLIAHGSTSCLPNTPDTPIKDGDALVQKKCPRCGTAWQVRLGDRTLEEMKLSPRELDSNGYRLDLMVFYDDAWKGRFGRRAVKRLGAIMALVDEIYSEKDTLKTKLDVNVVGIEHAKGERWAGEKWLPDPFWANLKNIAEKSAKEANLYIFFTDGGSQEGFAGLAPLGSLCDYWLDDRMNINGYYEGNHKGGDAYTASTVSHEIGHNLGMNHDFKEEGGKPLEDENGDYVVREQDGVECKGYMDYIEHTDGWSLCSVADFKAYINGLPDEFCLKPLGSDSGVDGGWSNWSAWTECSKTCGPGTKSRSRTCTKPKPSGNGKPCSGKKSQNTSCEKTACEECIDTDYTEESWATDSTNEGCWSYNENVEYCGEYDDDDFKAMEMCCACKEMMIK